MAKIPAFRVAAGALVLTGCLNVGSSPALGAPPARDAGLSAESASLRDGNYIGLAGWHRWVNGNAEARCESGQSWVAMDFNFNQPRPRYDIVVRLKIQPPSYFDSWSKYDMEPDVFRTQVLYGPGSPGRENYFNLPTRKIHNEIAGTVGVEVYSRQTGERIGWQVWDAILACGYDYAYWFTDQV
ncbi:hypothetical protein BJ973_004565 [Actinoplanes tereljensis]|uniref:Lipoprotein n=1 Tax=Paractinoplanes tereljensis TaxID=571912 RepID=A0A919NUY8_9ACTN|nr:hypothetical protein [Actinoplanes tereljensis]GIF23952.1 hypothetical protein Ate02nite_66820 [Actinoplanes tereljensis]